MLSPTGILSSIVSWVGPTVGESCYIRDSCKQRCSWSCSQHHTPSGMVLQNHVRLFWPVLPCSAVVKSLHFQRNTEGGQPWAAGVLKTIPQGAATTVYAAVSPDLAGKSGVLRCAAMFVYADVRELFVSRKLNVYAT